MTLEKELSLEDNSLEQNNLEQDTSEKESLTKDEFREALKEADILNIYFRIPKKEISRIANELYNDRKGKSSEDIKNEIHERLKNFENEGHLKYFGLNSIIKNYMGELKNVVENEKELEEIREQVVKELFSKHSKDLYNAVRMKEIANKLEMDLGILFRDRLKKNKKTA